MSNIERFSLLEANYCCCRCCFCSFCIFGLQLSCLPKRRKLDISTHHFFLPPELPTFSINHQQLQWLENSFFSGRASQTVYHKLGCRKQSSSFSQLCHAGSTLVPSHFFWEPSILFGPAARPVCQCNDTTLLLGTWCQGGTEWNSIVSGTNGSTFIVCGQAQKNRLPPPSQLIPFPSHPAQLDDKRRAITIVGRLKNVLISPGFFTHPSGLAGKQRDYLAILEMKNFFEQPLPNILGGKASAPSGPSQAKAQLNKAFLACA